MIIINIHITNNLCDISINSSGSNLNQRGYRKSTNIAPINEVLASGIIKLTGWNGNCNFLDPMCGSGTFLIEAAIIAGNVPANLNRKKFGFNRWNDWDLNLFNLIKNSQLNKIKKININIFGYDKSPSAIINFPHISYSISFWSQNFRNNRDPGQQNFAF